MSYTESAWQLGNDAFKRGEPDTANPWIDYPPYVGAYGQKEMFHTSWQNGWDFACDQARRKKPSGSGVTEATTE